MGNRGGVRSMSLEIDSILKKALKKTEKEEKKEDQKPQYAEPKTTAEPAPAKPESTTEPNKPIIIPKAEQKIEVPASETEIKPAIVPPPSEMKTKIDIIVEAPKEEKKQIVLPSHEEEGLQKVEELEILEEDVPAPPKLIITVYGEKGTGKTTTAMSFRERVAVFSFDDKSTIVKLNMYNNDPRIKVFVPIRKWDKSDKEKIPESAKKVWNLMLKTLDWLGNNWKPDWIVIDAVEEFEKLIEQVMRYDYGLGPYDGIANRNIWKYRKDLFHSFLARAKEIAKYGIIFTTYPEYSEHISQGEVVSRKPVPKWADYLQLVTDIVLYTFIDDRTGEYKVKVITSKLDTFIPSNKTVNVTGTNFWDALKLSDKLDKLKAFLTTK